MHHGIYEIPPFNLARLFRRACSRSFWSLWDSFLYLGKLHWFLYLLLSYFYDPGMFILRWSSNFLEKVVLKGSWPRRWHIVSLTLYIIIVYRVNLSKLSRKFVGALRITTDCRVSFIDLYLVFPRKFRIVFLPPHKDCNFTGTVLWYYNRTWVTCGNN